MKKYFITYGNELYSKSKERIIEQAKGTGEFDVLKAYNPSDLTEQTLNNPLIKEVKGGGFWIWKPDIIYQTLGEMDNGDILVYLDAGSTLSPSKEWDYYFKLLDNYEMIAFRINNKVGQYTKRSLLNKFKIYNGKYWHQYYQIQAQIILRKSDNTMNFIKEWMEACTYDNIFDVSKGDLKKQLPGFIAHRHDQSLYTALVYKYLNEGWIKVIWNRSNKRYYDQAFWSSRMSDVDIRNSGTTNKYRRILSRFILNPLRSFKQYFWQYINKITM